MPHKSERNTNNNSSNSDIKHLQEIIKLQEKKEHNLEESNALKDEQLQIVNTENETLQMEIERLTERNNEVNETLAQTIADFEIKEHNYKKTIHELEELNKQINVKLEKMDLEHKDLLYTVDTFQQKNQELLDSLDENNRRFEITEQKHNELIDKLDESNKDKDAKLRNIRIEVQQLLSELKNIIKEKDELTDIINTKNVQIEILEQSHKDGIVKLDNMKSDFEKISLELSTVKQENEQLNNVLQAKNTHIETLEKSCNESKLSENTNNIATVSDKSIKNASKIKTADQCIIM